MTNSSADMFSKGPWGITEENFGGDDEDTVMLPCGVESADGEQIITQDYGLAVDGLSEETIKANAQLIASAPDMLEVLRSTVVYLKAYGHDDHSPVVAALNAMITQATTVDD